MKNLRNYMWAMLALVGIGTGSLHAWSVKQLIYDIKNNKEIDLINGDYNLNGIDKKDIEDCIKYSVDKEKDLLSYLKNLAYLIDLRAYKLIEVSSGLELFESKVKKNCLIMAQKTIDTYYCNPDLGEAPNSIFLIVTAIKNLAKDNRLESIVAVEFGVAEKARKAFLIFSYLCAPVDPIVPDFSDKKMTSDSDNESFTKKIWNFVYKNTWNTVCTIGSSLWHPIQTKDKIVSWCKENKLKTTAYASLGVAAVVGGLYLKNRFRVSPIDAVSSLGSELNTIKKTVTSVPKGVKNLFERVWSFRK